jgi:hypothetical protein
MPRLTLGILVLLLGLALPAPAADAPDAAATPVEQYAPLRKEFNEATQLLYRATTDQERKQAADAVASLSPRVLAFAEKYVDQPVALEALVQVISQELWLINNTLYIRRGEPRLEARAVVLILQHHLSSPGLGEACRRARYGFSSDCEKLLRVALEKSPHREVRALACLRLAQCLNDRLQRLALLEERPDMAKRYQELFGEPYLRSLRRAKGGTEREVETLFERAAREYGEVKVPYEGTVTEKAASELHEIRHLSVGRQAPEIEGEDPQGVRFKLSDYRGKVVLLYFWSEY